MTVYVDSPRSYQHKRKKYSHLMADTLEELHAFAAELGIKRHWFDRDHYDIRESDFQMVIDAGATLVNARALVALRK